MESGGAPVADVMKGIEWISEYPKGSANGNTDSLSHLPQLATEHDRSGFSRLAPLDGKAVCLTGACGLHPPFTPVAGIGLGRLVPQPDSAVLCGLPLISTYFRDFCAHGPRMRTDDLSVPAGTLVTPVFVSADTVDGRLGRAPLWPATDAIFTPIFAVPSWGLIRQSYPPALQGHCRTRAVSPLGHAQEQPLPPAPRSLLLFMASDPAGPLGRLLLGSILRRTFYPQLPSGVAPGPSRMPTPLSTLPIPSNRDRAEPLSAPCSGPRPLRGFPPPLRPIFARPRRCCHVTLWRFCARYLRAGAGSGSNTESLRFTPPLHSSRPFNGPAHRSLSACSVAPMRLLLGESGARRQRPPP